MKIADSFSLDRDVAKRTTGRRRLSGIQRRDEHGGERHVDKGSKSVGDSGDKRIAHKSGIKMKLLEEKRQERAGEIAEEYDAENGERDE